MTPLLPRRAVRSSVMSQERGTGVAMAFTQKAFMDGVEIEINQTLFLNSFSSAVSVQGPHGFAL